jgi:GT2 family glycosyltransferase
VTPNPGGMIGLVSIVIPVRDRREELADCLDSIGKQDYPQVEIIVADDCSEDDTVEHVSEHYPGVAVLTNDARSGPSFLRNLGINAAKGEFVLFLDSDAELPRADWLSNMVATFRDHDGVAVLGGEVRPENPGVAYGRGVRFNGVTYAIEAREADGLVDCGYVATCNCFGRAEDMRAIGGFDPYYRFGGEDVDFVLRLARGRGRCCVSHATAVIHKRSPRGRHSDETYRYHVTRVRQQIKNSPGLRVIGGLLFDLLRFVVFYLLLPLKLLLKLGTRKSIRRENFTGGWLMMRGYIEHAGRIGEVRRSRAVDFLDPEQMVRFQTLNTERGRT